MRKALFIVLAVTVVACRKPEPETFVQLAPQFNLKGTLDGEELDMTPGENGFYLYTDVFDYGQGRYQFATTSELLNAIEGHAIGFDLFLEGEAGSSSAQVLNALSVGEVDLTRETSESFDILFSAVGSGDFLWTSSEGESGLGNTFEFQPVEFESVTCVNNEGDCSAMITFHPTPLLFCSSELFFGVINLEQEDEVVRFYPPEVTAQFDFVEWVVNGSTYSTMGSEPLVLPNNGLLTYNVEMLAFDMSTIPIILSQTFTSSSFECEFPHLSAGVVSENQPTIRIEYRSEMGQFYTSELLCEPDIEQPEEAYFEIHSIEAFSPNEEGLPTKKVVFSCQVLLKNDLGNPMGDTKWLVIDHGVIAFAY